MYLLNYFYWLTKAYFDQRDKFHLEKSRENLVSFILGRLPTGHGIPVTTGMIYNMKQQIKHEKVSVK